MFRIRLKDFRCFDETPSLEVLPITFLVGENSTGKTTFLAAVRQLLESFTPSARNSFNRDPYFLGGFDQIARLRGGRGGRAKSFSLELSIPAPTETAPAGRGIPRHPSTHRFTFTKGAPQPLLSEYSFSANDTVITMQIDEKVHISVVSNGVLRAIDLDDKQLPPASLVRQDPSFLRYIFDATRFSVKEEDKALFSDALTNLFTASTQTATRRTFAFAPVRTQPLRTYTPSEIEPSSLGSHVPLEMARRKITAPAEWERIQSTLSKFGMESGLFEEIDIRLLGKKDGDPFQVLVKTKGPSVNLVDVGYGVSQALPIIYQLDQSRRHEAYLMQQPEVHLHPRAQAAFGSLVAGLCRDRPRTLYMVETHSDFIIDRVRTEVAEGRLDNKNVTIIFFERPDNEVIATNIYLNEKGEIDNPPPTFRSFFLEEHARLLGL